MSDQLRLGSDAELLTRVRLRLARLSRDGYLPPNEWAALEAALGLGPLPPDPLVAAGMRRAVPDDPRGPHAACEGCGAALRGYPSAPAGFCCAWCAQGYRCPCRHGRGWSTEAEQREAAAWASERSNR